MPKTYSLDLRERVVAQVLTGKQVRAVAKTFDVSVSSAVKWSQRYRETGSAAPGKRGGRRPVLLVGEYRSWLLSRIAQSDFTLRGLVAELAVRGLKVDYRTVWNFVNREGLSFKKKRSAKRARPA